MWIEIFTAIALVLIIEGLLPFVSPGGFRNAMRRATELPDGQLRTLGLASMGAGLVLLYLVQ